MTKHMKKIGNLSRRQVLVGSAAGAGLVIGYSILPHAVDSASKAIAAGNWDQRRLYGGDGYDFVEDIIGETHILVEHHDDQGYLLCFPISKSEDEIREVIA